ncbi:uncharacterized protein cubi_00432 [Cryptosporidium ubiquitum]|uniref:Uncharacterized protein n=1 Tax=Cryptosporidium ubiquitum TaxID=857276 RepID=A0A1J4MHY3_9CRYT|nr:uncharacterized protein cubi_00432 [Cryptosporidium ubiquitum]OII72437.1 hypothetical protein cubi_00432 [Cryptosporidium ubiquitum]
MVREVPNKGDSSPALTPPKSDAPKAAPVPVLALPKDSAPVNIPVVSVSVNERSEVPNSDKVIQVPTVPKEGGNTQNQTSSPPVTPPPPKQSSSQQSPSKPPSSPAPSQSAPSQSAPSQSASSQSASSQPTPSQAAPQPQQSSSQQSSSQKSPSTPSSSPTTAQSVPPPQQPSPKSSTESSSKPAQTQMNSQKSDTQKSVSQKSQKTEFSKMGETSKQIELNGIGSNLDTRRSVENTKFSLVESELDSKFPDIKTAFSKDGLQEVRVALIFIVISLIMVIGFSIRKYRKLRKGGEQVRNITNTVFPVKIVSLYLYIFLCFPITVLMQFLSCIAPVGFGMFNVVQSIYQGSCYIWLWDLFVEYFGGSEQIVTAIRRTGPYQIWKVPPFMIPTNPETYFQPKIVIVSYILMVQFLPINVLVSILNIIHPSKAFLYNIFLILSLSISIYGIMLIYWPSKEALQPYQGGWKFGILVIQSFSIIIIDSIIRLAKYENREYNSIVYKLYWKLMLTCGVATICTLAAVAIIDSREIYQIYNLSIPTKNSENIPENKAMLNTKV